MKGRIGSITYTSVFLVKFWAIVPKVSIFITMVSKLSILQYEMVSKPMLGVSFKTTNIFGVVEVSSLYWAGGGGGGINVVWRNWYGLGKLII